MTNRRLILNDFDTENEVRVAIKNNDLDSLKELIQSLPDKDITIIVASDNDRLEIAKYLLNNFEFTEENPIARMNGLDRALRLATSIEMAKLLIEHGADVHNSNVLFYAVEYIVDLSLIEFYLKQGIDKKFLDKALRKIFDYEYTDLVNLLIEYGASPYIAASYAVYNGSLYTLTSILDSHYIDDDDFDDVIDILDRGGYNKMAKILVNERTVKKETFNEDSRLFNLPGPVLEGLMDNLRL